MVKLTIPSLQFEIGTSLYIERQMLSQNLKGTTKIIGAREPCYLLTEMPFASGAPMLSTLGETIVVRFIHGGKMFGFKAEVDKIILHPFPLIVMKCPDEVEEMTLRKHERLHCHFPSSLKLLPIEIDPDDKEKKQLAAVPSPPPLHSHVIDLAEGGCQLVALIHRPRDYSPEALEFQSAVPASEHPHYTAEALKTSCVLDRKASLTFELPSPMDFKFPNISCEIRWSKVVNMHYLVGIRFLDLESETKNKIQTVIDYQKKFFSPHPLWL